MFISPQVGEMNEAIYVGFTYPNKTAQTGAKIVLNSRCTSLGTLIIGKKKKKELVKLTSPITHFCLNVSFQYIII